MSERDGPTCEIGFWAQVTRGCPLCHPGPCKLGYDLPMDLPSRWPPLFVWVVLVVAVVTSLAGKP